MSFLKYMQMLLPCLVVVSAAHALPVLSPAEPLAFSQSLFLHPITDHFSIRLGFRGDYVYNRKLIDVTEPVGRYSLFSNAGVLTANFFDRIDLYGLVGAASQTFALVYDAPVVSIKNTFYTTTVWGAGIKALLGTWNWTKQSGPTFLSASFDYERINTVAPWITTAGVDPFERLGSAYLADVIPNCRYQEIQGALAIGHRIKKLIPYMAVKWSQAHLKEQEPAPILPFQSLKSQYHLGYVVGISLIDVACMTVTAEARFVDETAMTIAGAFRF